MKVVIYIKDMKELDKMDQVYREFFRAYRKPARVIIQALSPIDGIEVEIEAIAMAPEPK